MDLLTPAFLTPLLQTFASAAGLAVTATKVKFPQKYPWLLGFGLIFLSGLLNTLYQYGGYYVIVFPALFWVQVVLQTTGSLALAIGCYSVMHNDNNISAHWYSLPTGSSPLAMLSQYVPSIYIHTGLFTALIAYMFYAKNKGLLSSIGHKLFVPVGVTLVAAVTYTLNPKIPVLDIDTLYSVSWVVVSLLFAAVLQKNDEPALKKKLF